MNIEETLNKLSKMKMSGMYRAYDSYNNTKINDGLSVDEFIAHLVDAEWEERYNRKLNRLLSSAKLRYNASFEDLTFKHDRGLNKKQILKYSDSTWISKKESIIITGPTGVGKSYIGCALGHQACYHGYKVMYFNCLKLFSNLMLAKADGTYPKQMNKINQQDLIIFDDFGLQVFDTMSRLILLEILEDRYEKASTVFLTQLPTNKWHHVIGDPTIADAICDRLINTSNIIKLKGESLRGKNKIIRE